MYQAAKIRSNVPIPGAIKLVWKKSALDQPGPWLVSNDVRRALIRTLSAGLCLRISSKPPVRTLGGNACTCLVSKDCGSETEVVRRLQSMG